jgi:hypothetical protein
MAAAWKLRALTVMAWLAGCNLNPAEPGNDAALGEDTGGAASAGDASATGGTDGDVDPTARFLGTWVQTGSLTLVCTDGSQSTQTVLGSVSVTRGATSDLNRSVAGGACALSLNINGTVADLAASVICPANPTDGSQATVTSWRLTVGADGLSASEVGKTTVDVPSAAVTCAGTYSTVLVR